jgi:hypothetical protein
MRLEHAAMLVGQDSLEALRTRYGRYFGPEGFVLHCNIEAELVKRCQ